MSDYASSYFARARTTFKMKILYIFAYVIIFAYDLPFIL